MTNHHHKFTTTQRLAHLLIGAGITLFPCANLLAEEPTVEIDKLVISAVRDNKGIDEIPRSLIVVDKKQLDEMQPASVAEALAHEPNVEVAGGPRASQQSPSIRGLSGNKVLQTIDGVRQNFESGHRPTYYLDPVLLKNVEVLKGPASSLWGSGAIGGVVAQNTVSAADLLKPHQDIGGLLKQGYNDNGEQWLTTVAGAARTEQFDLLLSGYYRDRQDIELGDGSTLANSAARDHGTLAKGEWQITDTQNLTLNLRQSESDSEVPSNAAAPVGTSNFLLSRQNKNQHSSLDYRLDTTSPLINTQVLLYRNEASMDESRLSDGRADSTELDTLGLNLNNRSDFTHFSLLYGIDGYRDEFSASRSGIDRPTPPEAETEVSGIFALATVPLIENSLRTEIGLRQDTFKTDANNLNDSRRDEALSPSAALIWETTSWLQLVARYDEAFRAPSSEELYTTGTHFCMFPGFCNTFVANPDLDPEQAKNKELMGKMHFNHVLTAEDHLAIQVSIFRNDVDDFIEQFVTAPTFFPIMDPGYTSWRNVSKARLEGFELNTDYQWQALALRLGYGQTRGEDRETGDALSGIPADKWTANVSYEFFPKQFAAGIRLTKTSAQNDVPAGNPYDSYEGYTLTDFYTRWQPAGKLGESLNVDMSINNLTDKHYRVAFEELYQPGREIRVAATYRF